MNIEEAKAKLEAEKTELEAQLSKVAVRDSEDPGGFRGAESPGEFDTEPDADPLDEADEMANLANNTAITNELEVRYNNVCAALEKIAAGTYGICEVSGEPIEADRLEANPAARTSKAHME